MRALAISFCSSLLRLIVNYQYRLQGIDEKFSYRYLGACLKICVFSSSPKFRVPHLLARLPELLGKRLGCWCVPHRRCHGLQFTRFGSPSGFCAAHNLSSRKPSRSNKIKLWEIGAPGGTRTLTSMVCNHAPWTNSASGAYLFTF